MTPPPPPPPHTHSTPTAQSHTSVLVLAGGPDAERAVSLETANAIADALEKTERFEPRLIEIERLDQNALAALPGDVVFPALHGSWGEGGPLQDLLDADGRPYVGCGPRAARTAMDKVATKLLGAAIGLRTLPTHVFDPRDSACPFELPVVAKPVHDGSSCGLYVCRTPQQWDHAHASITDAMRRAPASYLVEPCLKRPSATAQVAGRELTVGLLDEITLPVIEIVPAEATGGVYDYEAKYTRDDTRYLVHHPDAPDANRPGDRTLTPELLDRVSSEARRLGEALGVRHIARIDFILDEHLEPYLLEANTMPGFTAHSLVPLGARTIGLGLPDLCARLVDRAACAGARPEPARAH